MAGSPVRSLIVDTSVAVKWFSREDGTEAALKLRDDLIHGQIELSAPDLLLYELANVLRHHPRFSAEDVSAAVTSVLDLGIRFVPPSANLLAEAARLAFDRKITVTDAAFVTLAGLEGTILVTADKRLAGRADDKDRILALSEYRDSSGRELNPFDSQG